MSDKKDAAKTKIKLTNTFKGVSPSLFFGNDKWSGTTKAQYKIKLSEANLNQIAKNAKISKSQIKPAAGGKKTTVFGVNGYMISLESTKKNRNIFRCSIYEKTRIGIIVDDTISTKSWPKII